MGGSCATLFSLADFLLLLLLLVGHPEEGHLVPWGGKEVQHLV